MPKPNLHLDRIRELIALMRESGVSELAVEFPDFKVSLKREMGVEDFVELPGAEEQGARRAAAVESGPALVPVVAHMVGTFRAGGDSQRKVAVGDSVAAGQVIGAIEAMRVRNDLPSPVSGIVREVLAADGAPVEYGQPVMLIETVATAEGVEVEAEAL